MVAVTSLPNSRIEKNTITVLRPQSHRYGAAIRLNPSYAAAFSNAAAALDAQVRSSPCQDWGCLTHLIWFWQERRGEAIQLISQALKLQVEHVLMASTFLCTEYLAQLRSSFLLQPSNAKYIGSKALYQDRAGLFVSAFKDYQRMLSLQLAEFGQIATNMTD